MWLSPEEWDAVGLSFLVASVAVAISLPFSIVLAYFLALAKFRMKWFIEVLVNLPLVIPPVVTGYFLLVLFARNGILGNFLENTLGLRVVFTWFGAALAAALVGFPLMVRAMRLGFENTDPRLPAVARGLGAGRLDAFFTISLPLAARGIVAGSVLSFGRGLGEFGATIVVAGNIPGVTQTLPLAIFSRVQQPGGIESSWRLVVLSVLLACIALGASEWLELRGRRRESA